MHLNVMFPEWLEDGHSRDVGLSVEDAFSFHSWT
jgi:hypothetical protein